MSTSKLVCLLRSVQERNDVNDMNDKIISLLHPSYHSIIHIFIFFTEAN